MKKLLFALMLLLSISMADAYVYVRQGYYNDNTVYVGVSNPTDSRWENVRVSLYVPELGIYQRGTSFDVRSGDSAREMFELSLPQDGRYYGVIVTVQGRDIRETTHTWLKSTNY